MRLIVFVSHPFMVLDTGKLVMEQRIRSRETVGPSSCVSIFSAGCTPGSWKYFDEYVEDFIGKGKERHPVTNLIPDSPFYSRKRKFVPSIERILKSGTFPGSIYNGEIWWAPDLHVAPPDGWGSVIPTDQELVSKLWERTNPLRPEVSVPIAVAELIEATTLLKIAGATIINKLGSIYLNYRFGWSTLLADVKSLHNITQSIESRIREFNSLLGSGGQHRAITLFKDRGSWKDEMHLSGTSYTRATYTETTHEWSVEVWGSVRWFPKDRSLIPVLPIEQFNLAVQTLLDLQTPDWHTVWEAIPFSWLIDYFVNVGPVLQQVSTIDTVEPRHTNLMTRRTMTATQTGYRSDKDFCQILQYGVSRSEEKIRACFEPIPSASLLSFSFLTNSEAKALLGLLAALGKYK